MSAWKQSLAVLGLASLAALPLTAQTPPAQTSPAQPAGHSAKPAAGAAATGKKDIQYPAETRLTFTTQTAVAAK